MENEPTKLEFVDTPEQLQASLAADANQGDQQEQPQTQEAPAVQQEPTPEPEPQQYTQPEQQAQPEQYTQPEYQQETQQYTQPEYQQPIQSNVDYDAEVQEALKDFFPDTPEQETPILDERVEAISNFVRDTGRDPSDWFAYQQLNPSEMDDKTAVRVQAASEYPGLSAEDLTLLVESKYKLDPDVHSDEEVRLSRIQLKIDADRAKQQIEKFRSEYAAPITNQPSEEVESFVDEAWINQMSSEVDSLQGLEFNIGNGKSFTYGLDDSYKGNLKESNVNVESFFDQYIQSDGNWDFDKFNSHRAVVDNIDSIVASAYRQGLGDGQRGLVNRAANVSMDTAQRMPQTNQNSIASQLKNIMGGRGTTTFKL